MITINNLEKGWRKNGLELKAIGEISLSVEKGEFISFIGPSGCGKTTLLRLVAGLLKPSRGEISYNMEKRNSVKKLSIVFQNPVLLAWRNVVENVNLPLELRNKKGNIDDKLKLVGLENFKDHYPNELSGGVAQRVAIARALVLNPDLLLMDEPFGSLDEMRRNKLNLELLKIHKKIRPTIMFVTHSISEAVLLSNKVVVLSDSPTRIKEIVEINLDERTIATKETLDFQEYVKCLREKLEP
ncbi:ABC transporter ATP-binding protein [Candidatus Woesearchaeota archaeon]|nr:ABC transporter ATP-binding protein [Candidatus Woesearchaeota archaeon]